MPILENETPVAVKSVEDAVTDISIAKEALEIAQITMNEAQTRQMTAMQDVMAASSALQIARKALEDAVNGVIVSNAENYTVIKARGLVQEGSIKEIK